MAKRVGDVMLGSPKRRESHLDKTNHGARNDHSRNPAVGAGFGFVTYTITSRDVHGLMKSK